MARRDEVDTAFKGMFDAAAAAVPVPRPGRRVPADLAYHPKGLPPADALPSLTQMADPECKTTTFSPSAASPRSPSWARGWS
jgi:hypothetical protein